MLFDDRDITDEGGRLHAKFQALGDLSGRSLGEIAIRLNTDPVEVSYFDDGTTARRWAKLGYEIVLLFDKNDRCIKVVREFTNYSRYEPPRSKTVGRVAWVLVGVFVVLFLLLAFVKKSALH